MISRTNLNKLIIFGFLVLIGFCLAKALASGSFMGIVLAMIALGAAIYFLYILAQVQQDREQEKAEEY